MLRSGLEFLCSYRTEGAVMNNGFATNWFKPIREVSQGCPLSLYLFTLGAEILLNRLRQTVEIKGINLFGNEVKISQFADDNNLFCADVASVQHALNTVSKFGAISGLKLNLKKTKAILKSLPAKSYSVVQ